MAGEIEQQIRIPRIREELRQPTSENVTRDRATTVFSAYKKVH
jgi:hypothetical protein